MLKSITLTNYRSLQKANFEFSKNKVLFIGPNGSGKTNVLEAIFYLHFLKSFRFANDKYLVKNEKDFFRINAKIDFSNILVVYSNQKRLMKVDETTFNLKGDYIGKFKSVYFTPDSLKIIKENPKYRRSYLDILISQSSKKYLNTLKEYFLLLRQRNEYLKNSKIDETYLDIITDNLIEAGAYIYSSRILFLSKIEYEVSKTYSTIKEKEFIFKFKYNIEELDYKKYLQNFYEKNKSRELLRKVTMFGIHKEDFTIYLNDLDVKYLLSQGELKILILAMKLAEVKAIKDYTKISPCLILDDIFSELDSTTKSNLITLIPSDLQVFISTTELNDLDKFYSNNKEDFQIFSLGGKYDGQ